MKKNSAIYAVTTAIVILLASLIGCDCAVANDWGFGPIEPEAETVDAANILAMKTPATEPQQVVCENGVCRIVETTPAATGSGFAPVYVMQDAVCPCGCGIAGCNCGMSVRTVYRTSNASWLASHLSGDHGIDVTGMSESQMEAIHNSLHGGAGAMGLSRGNGYGVFGLRARPWFWRVRPFLRARMGW